MKLSTKNDPIFVHFRRIAHREDLRFNLTIARQHIAQCHMPDTYNAVAGAMTTLLEEYEHVDSSPARKAKVEQLLMRLRVAIPGCAFYLRRPFRHTTRLYTLLRRATAHGVSEERSRPRLAELVSLYANEDGRALPRPRALTAEEVSTIIQAVTPAALAATTPVRKVATNWKARALAAEALITKLERKPAKRLRVVKTPGQPVSTTRSESSKRAWITIRRNRALKAVAS